jgi:hypothetical protein
MIFETNLLLLFLIKLKQTLLTFISHVKVEINFQMIFETNLLLLFLIKLKQTLLTFISHVKVEINFQMIFETNFLHEVRTRGIESPRRSRR